MRVTERIAFPNNLRFRSPPKVSPELEGAASGCLERADLSEAASNPDTSGLTGFQKVGLTTLTALSVVGSLGGAVGLAARHLPVCEAESGLVAVQQDQLCVSPDLSTKVDALHRVARGQFYRGDAVEDLASQANRILQPKTPASREPDAEFTVNSWNLHHGTSQNKTGARDQLGTQIERLNESDADVDLLQEVLPWDAQKIVDGTGKVGYFSQTTPRQGNLILVSPELVVTENARVTLNHQIESERQAKDVVGRESGEEPRAAQFLHLQGNDTDGRSVAVFNTHLSTGSATPQDRAAEHKVFERLVDSHRERTDALVGGGDLNTRDGQAIVQTFKDKGLRVEGARIDWLVSDNSGTSEVKQVDVRTEDGTYVSDHPLVEGRYTFETHTQ